MHLFLLLFIAVVFSPLINSSPTLIWSDEFSGNSLDSTSWTALLGDGSSYGIPGWGNNERECYVASQASLNGMGSLLIAARNNGPNAPPCINPGKSSSSGQYTSARLSTDGKRAFVWNSSFPTIRIESKFKVPMKYGSWYAAPDFPDFN